MSNFRMIAEPGKHDIVITRTFDAPREVVFKAYTDPELLAQWWAPERYDVEIERLEARSGGSWRILNRDADGNEYWFHGVVHDVTPPERIIETFEWEGMPGHPSLEIAHFEDVGGKTKLIARSVYPTVEDRDGMLTSMNEGDESPSEIMEAIYDRLAALVEREQGRRHAA